MAESPHRDQDSTEVFRNISAVEEAEHRAYRRGRDQAELTSKLETHFRDDDRRFEEIKTSQDATTDAVKTVGTNVATLGQKVDTAAAVTAARAQDAKLAAESQVSTRTFLIGLLGAVGTVVAALAATGHI